MTPILIVAILILILGAVSGATMSAFRKEKRSIESHQRVMNVIEDIAHGASASGTGAVEEQGPRRYAHVRTMGRVNGPGQSRLGDAKVGPDEGLAARLNPPEPPRPAEEVGSQSLRKLADQRQRPRTGREKEHLSSPRSTKAFALDEPTVEMQRVVFDDIHGVPTTAARPTEVPHRTKGRHVSSGTGRIASLLVVLVVGVVSVTGVLVALSKSKPSRAGTAVSGTTKKVSKGTSVPSSTTSTTQATQLSAVSTSSSGADFQVNSSALTVVLHASAPCWVEESSTPYGKIVWDSTLAAGQSYTITTTAPLWLRTGNVGVLSLNVNGLPVAFSAAPGPYNFTFTAS